MTGLRERKKRARRRRILDAAKRLFHRHGFTAATMEAIAELSEVAPATVYNYYRTKGDLLLALVADGDREIIDSGRSLMQSAPSDPVDAVCDLLGRFTSKSLEQLNRETWRQVHANTILQAGADFGGRMFELNRRFSAEVALVLESLKSYGQLRSDCDSRVAADILFHVNHALFIELICDESMASDRYEALLHSYIGFVLDPMRARSPAPRSRAPRRRGARD